MQFISDFADAAVVLPFVLVLWAVMGWLGHLRLISLWVAAVGLVMLVMLGLKLAWLEASVHLGIAITSPSGHTASAGIVYGGLAWLLLRRLGPRWLAGLATLAVVAVIGFTRVALGAHTPLETVLGGAVALGGVVVLAFKVGPAPRLPFWPVLIVFLATASLLHGQQAPFERLLRDFVLSD